MLAGNRLGSLVTSQLQLFVATATIAIISGWEIKYFQSINTIEVMSFFSININKDDARQSPWNIQIYKRTYQSQRMDRNKSFLYQPGTELTKCFNMFRVWY